MTHYLILSIIFIDYYGAIRSPAGIAQRMARPKSGIPMAARSARTTGAAGAAGTDPSPKAMLPRIEVDSLEIFYRLP
jgi:hypothetical protein